MLDLEMIERLIASSRPRTSFVRGPMLILLGVAILFGAWSADSKLIFADRGLAGLIPPLLLLAIIVFFVRTVRQQKALARNMQEMTESVLLKQWPRAVDASQRVLSKPVSQSVVRAESLLALAIVAEASQAFHVSQRIYESLLEERAADPIQLHHACVGLGTALLRTGQTTDAVNLIDRLQRDEDLPGPLQANVELLAVFREIMMGHAADYVDRVEDRQQLFRRHLGTRAGFGYGLLALVLDRAGQTERAAQLWHDATMLVSVGDLTERFSELRAIANKYPAAQVPASIAANTNTQVVNPCEVAMGVG